jgi:hypothetical protein
MMYGNDVMDLTILRSMSKRIVPCSFSGSSSVRTITMSAPFAASAMSLTSKPTALALADLAQPKADHDLFHAAVAEFSAWACLWLPKPMIATS